MKSHLLNYENRIMFKNLILRASRLRAGGYPGPGLRRQLLVRSPTNISPLDQALDDALEATFPASDPPAIPWTRIATPTTLGKERCG
jgi:hypothetical protein